MSLDHALLRRATGARDRAGELQREAARARHAFHEAVCDLHRAGGSLREIAGALDLSHQRVHQIVEGARSRGIWARLTGRGASPSKLSQPAVCSFCGIDQFDAHRLVAGPGIFICDGCVALARGVLGAGEAQANERARLQLGDPALRCEFCGDGPSRTGGRLVTGRDRTVCASCLDICHEVVTGTSSDRPATST